MIKTLHIQACEDCSHLYETGKFKNKPIYFCAQSEKYVEDIEAIPEWCELRDYKPITEV